MSKISERLTNLGQAQQLRLGFGQSREKKRSPVMLTVGLQVHSAKLTAAEVDIILLRPGRGGKPVTSAPLGATLWGANLADSGKSDLEALKEAGCDFIVFESGSAPASALADEAIGHGLAVTNDIKEERARAIEDLPFDFLLLRDTVTTWPLTMAGLLLLQERISTFSKHIFLEVATLPGPEDLPILRDMPVSALVFDLSAHDPQKVAELRDEIAKLEPRKQRADHVAILPSNMMNESSSNHHEPAPDEGGDDEDDDF